MGFQWSFNGVSMVNGVLMVYSHLSFKWYNLPLLYNGSKMVRIKMVFQWLLNGFDFDKGYSLNEP